ncbi:MAG: 50S ribosomal protein L30 [Rhodobacteraceae bacterium]|nr:50S ribosomal protein L30 [Paracoccaceae bacterium]
MTKKLRVTQVKSGIGYVKDQKATLRALGFSRMAILTSFLLEALLLSLIGGVVGALAARAPGGAPRAPRLTLPGVETRYTANTSEEPLPADLRPAARRRLRRDPRQRPVRCVPGPAPPPAARPRVRRHDAHTETPPAACSSSSRRPRPNCATG